MSNLENSKLVLNDPKAVSVDKSGRTLGYFCKNEITTINKEILNELKNISKKLGKKNVRICLHNNQIEKLHSMVNLINISEYSRPHKHLNKAESYHIIEGRMAFIIFDEVGTVIDKCILEPDGNFLLRVGANVFHTAIPLTEIVIFHESRLGPFPKEGDSVYPSWAPDAKNPILINEYVKDL